MCWLDFTRSSLCPTGWRACLCLKALALLVLCLGATIAFAEDKARTFEPRIVPKLLVLTVPVLFSGPVERVPYTLFLDGVFVGLMGDAIRAPLGLHRISIQGPHGSWLDMNLKFGIGSIGNEGVSVRQPTCWDRPEFVASWPWSYKPLADRTIIDIGQPVIGQREIKPCPRAMLKLFREIGRTVLTIQSSPEGAKIMIDGKSKGKTPQKIGIPYRENTDQITVVLRREGYVNFVEQLRPPFPDEKEIKCKLERF